jgi:hypothetical protein
VAESNIKDEKLTEFKLAAPVKVTKGEKYWLANTAFSNPTKSGTRIYQHFLHERVSTTEGQPWGDYSNEPTNWDTLARPLKELESPETSKINCEKCNTESWLQEEPKGFELLNPNREGQEEGGQTYSYAYGKIEEGAISEEAPVTAPDTIFASATPATVDSGDGNSVELGVKFSSEVAGSITGVRFYKAAANTGIHVGSLWSASGTLLASATFSSESASGWQHVNFATPVAIAAGTTYVAGYFAPNGHYSDTSLGFASGGVSNPPLQALANSVGADGVYAYSTASTFPTSTYKASNYWVDVDFEPAGAPGQVAKVSATAGVGSARLTWSAPSSGGAVTEYTITPYVGSTAQPTTTVTGSPPATGATVVGLTAGSSYTFTVTASNSVGSGPASGPSNVVTPTAPDTIFASATPATVDSGDGNSVELGVKFSSEVAGSITGVRFYKAAANTGTHVGSLWSASGTLLASATFSGESASGWQHVNFATPVAIAAGTTYVAGYFAPNGNYSDTSLGFASGGVSNPPLQALANSVGADGVYAYSTASTFPTSTYKASNYWVDVDFEP